jgi:elongator complex protein 4
VDKDLIENYQRFEFFSYMNFIKRQEETGQSHFDMIIEDLRKISTENPDNLLRVCISSLGSPVWYSETFQKDVLKFLAQLKSIVRYNENIVCLITLPLHLINLMDDQLIFMIRRFVDVNINLESFDNVEKQTNEVFKQYHGIVHIKKLQTICAHQSHKPESFDLAFKLKSHRFVIEKLHLPPELGDSDSTERPSMSCATTGGGNKALDF